MSRLFTVGGAHKVVFAWDPTTMNSEEFTYVSLARWDSLSNIPTLFSRVVSGDLCAPYVWIFDRGSGPRMEWTVVAGTFATATEADAVPTGEWLFHAFTFSRTFGSRIFRARAAEASRAREVRYSSRVAPNNTVYAPATSTLTIGQSEENTFFTFGGAQELLWYIKRDLSQTDEIWEIQQMMCGGRPRQRVKSATLMADLDVTLAGGTVANFAGSSTGTITGTSLTTGPPPMRMRSRPRFSGAILEAAVDQTIAIPLATMSIVGNAPTVNVVNPIAAATLSISAFAPNPTVAMGIPTATLDVNETTPLIDVSIPIGAATLTQTTYTEIPQPSIPIPAAVLDVNERTPTVSVDLPIPAATASITGYAVVCQPSIPIDAAVVTIDSFAPTPDGAMAVDAGEMATRRHRMGRIIRNARKARKP